MHLAYAVGNTIQFHEISSSPSSLPSSLPSTLQMKETAHTLARLDKLARRIFQKHAPVDPPARASVPCARCGERMAAWAPSCGQCGATVGACVLSGKPIHEGMRASACRRCKHRFLESEAGGARHCGLCHAPLHLASTG